MQGDWLLLPFSAAVELNPAVKMNKGERYPFVDMASVDPGFPWVSAPDTRVFDGSGSRFAHGDTLMARITPSLENGKIARYRGSDTPAQGSTEFIVVRGRPGVTTSGFAYYLSRWNRLRSFAVSQMTGSSGRQRVPVESFDKILVPVPPLKTQQVMVSLLGSLDDKIELNRRMSETLDEMARTIFHDWFIRPTSSTDTDLVEPPRSLREVLTLTYGKGLRKNDRVPGPVPVYGSGGVFDFHNEALISGPALIVGRKGTVGSLYWEDGPSYPGDTVFYVESELPLTYCYYLLGTLGLDDMNTDAAVPGLNRENAYRLEVPSPSPDLIAKFDAIVGPMRERIRAANAESTTLADLRDTLLPKLIAGELRIPEAEQLVSEVA